MQLIKISCYNYFKYIKSRNMQKSSLLILLITILSTLGVYFIPSQNVSTQQMYQIKIQFENFKHQYAKKYQTIEQQAYRFKVFKENSEMIARHNLDPKMTYKMKINQFGDLTEEEFRYKILTPGLGKNMPKYQPEIYQRKMAAPPASVDWRDKGVVNPVKDQGACGSCWAFSTTGSLQAAVAMKNKTLNNYSQQQLVDCCSYSKYGCKGCSGSWPEWALEYVKDAGIVLQKEYPYVGVANPCKPIPTAQKILAPKKPFTLLQNTTNEILKENLATLGPLSISVDAYRWQYYYSGIFNQCGDTQIDHAVLLVGYQTDGTWIVKNSWGPTWGQKGYIRVSSARTACLIRAHVVIPHLE